MKTILAKTSIQFSEKSFSIRKRYLSLVILLFLVSCSKEVEVLPRDVISFGSIDVLNSEYGVSVNIIDNKITIILIERTNGNTVYTHETNILYETSREMTIPFEGKKTVKTEYKIEKSFQLDNGEILITFRMYSPEYETNNFLIVIFNEKKLRSHEMFRDESILEFDQQLGFFTPMFNGFIYNKIKTNNYEFFVYNGNFELLYHVNSPDRLHQGDAIDDAINYEEIIRNRGRSKFNIRTQKTVWDNEVTPLYEGLDMSKIKEEKTELIKGTMWTYFLYYKNFEGENKIRKMTLDINTGEYKIDDSQK